MKLNQRRSDHVVVDKRSIPVQYFFTKDDVSGQAPGPRRVWVVINFTHPETKQQEKLRITEPQSILEAPEKEIHLFVEREVECFFKHCDEEVRS